MPHLRPLSFLQGFQVRPLENCIPAPLMPGRSAGGGSSSSLVLPALLLNATTH